MAGNQKSSKNIVIDISEIKTSFRPTGYHGQVSKNVYSQMRAKTFVQAPEILWPVMESASMPVVLLGLPAGVLGILAVVQVFGKLWLKRDRLADLGGLSVRFRARLSATDASHQSHMKHKLHALNFIQTGATGLGVHVNGGNLSTQVPKGYDRMAAMYTQCRIYKSKAKFTAHNLSNETGAIHITGYIHDDKVEHQEPFTYHNIFTCSIPGFKHEHVL
eukprot:2283967-Pleurochrysis_carterae.AAC.1